MAVVMFSVVAFGQVRATHVVKGRNLLAKEAIVCFVDFRIGLVVGKSEADIGNGKYCKYTIDRKKFFSLLTPMPPATFYMGGNVRAKVCLSVKDIYYVDYNGVVRHGGERFQINKLAFTKALRRLGGGEGEFNSEERHPKR